MSNRSPTSNRDERYQVAPTVFLTLAADGSAAEEDQRSLPRRLAMVAALCLVALGPLVWAGSAQSFADDGPQAVLSQKNAGSADDDDDDDDSGAGTGSDPGTGQETAGNTDRGGQDTGGSTRGETDGRDGTGQTERTQGTGQETVGNTDRAGLDTGKPTQGDTDA
jgi:hypothetical protein